mgnify:CR=1 FL=1
MKKRIVSLLLAVVLVLGLMPTALAAAATFDSFFDGLPVIAETEPGSPNSTNKWMVTTLDSEDVLMSGNKDKNSSSSILQLTFTGDANLTFEYKVSSEAKCDKLNITLGSAALVADASGEIDWTPLEVEAKSGDVLTVVYTKDYFSAEGSDCVYLRGFTCGSGVTITFHNGSETVTQNIYGGSGTLRANTFTAEGKVFAGWATTESGEVAYFDGASIDSVTEAMDLYAVWADAFTVTFMNGDKTVTTVNVAQNAPIGALNIPADPSKTGYTFDGWYSDKEELTAGTVISDNTTFAAKWTPITYTIVFDANGGTGEVEPIKNVSYDQDVTLPQSGFTRPGYAFNGWANYSSSTSGDAAGAVVKNLTSENGGTVTKYAAWLPNAVTVTVDLNYDGAEKMTYYGSVGSRYDYLKAAESEYSTSLNDPVREGYLFLGWFDAAEGGNAYKNGYNYYEYTAADAQDVKTLYAHWAEAVTITFDANGGYCWTTSKAIAKNTAYGSLPSVSRSGKVFEGWYTTKDDGGDRVDDTTVFNENTTLYARWRDYQITLSFSANGGTGTMENVQFASGTTINLPDCTFTRRGYLFAGWGTYSSSTTVAYANNADYTNTASYGDSTATLYALWTDNRTEEEKAADEAADARLTAAERAINKNYFPEFGLDENALEMIRDTLTEAGITDVTAEFKEAVTGSGYTGGTASIDKDGTIHYKWDDSKLIPSSHIYIRPTVVLSYTNEKALVYTKESTAPNFSIPLDGNKAKAALAAVADRIDAAIPTAINDVTDLTTLQRYPLKAGVDASAVDYDESDDLEMCLTAEWGSSHENVIAIAEDNSYSAGYYAPYKATVTLPTEDTNVTLTLTLIYNGRNDLTVTHVYTVTVKGTGGTHDDYYKTLLDTIFGADGALTDPATGTAINKAAVTGDIQFPTTKDVSELEAYKDFDGKYTPIFITSSNEAVIESATVGNQARLTVYRPLPGDDDANVTITVSILRRPGGTGKDYANMPVLAKLEIPVTVKALTQQELNDAAAFMSRVCTEAVYWEGIRKANTSRDSITGDLQPFVEIVPTDDGQGYKFLRGVVNARNVGVKVDKFDGWEAHEKYRTFRSSVNGVINHETLLIARDPGDTHGEALSFPEYNTPVKIDSLLTHAVYGKYYEKFKSDPKYAQFARFYKQPVETVVTVKGTTGIDDPNVKDITVTVQVAGSEFDSAFTDLTDTYTCRSNAYKYASDALLDVLSKAGYTCVDSSYITSVTDSNNHTLAAGDAAHGIWSGWMYTVNGQMPMLNETTYARLDQYLIRDKDVIRFYYVDCPTENGHHTPDQNGETITKAATHAEAGTKTYTCAVCGQLITETIPATGHTWGDVTYTWNERHTTCTAVRTCTANDGGEDSETANATYAVITEPTATATGLGRWTAVFENKAFETQTYDVTLPATGGNTSGGSTKPSGSAGKPSVRKDGDAAGESAGESVRARFDDVKSSHWFSDAVEYVAENGIMGGTDSRTFSPDASATRAMLVTILHRMAGSPDADAAHSFSDLSRGAWYESAVAWAAENGIVDGVGASRFAPNAGITREQLAVILYRYAQHCGLDVSASEDLSGYADASSVSPWARSAMAWAVNAGLISGRSTSALAPQSGATRAEIAQILMRFAKLLKK